MLLTVQEILDEEFMQTIWGGRHVKDRGRTV